MLLEVDDLVVEYRNRNSLFHRRPAVRAVNGVSFTIAAGETYGLVGESGSGKSSIGNTVLGLNQPASGTIRFDGTDIGRERSYPPPVRRNIQAVFQNPGSSLNPSMLVNEVLTEPLRIHRRDERDEWRDRVAGVLDLVGLAPEHLGRSPHEFSGGQRQRIAIARALVLEPRLLVLDEAVSALDVSTQGQIINLLSDLKDRLGLAFLFISHDLAVVGHICDRVGVMYAGTIVEQGPASAIFEHPSHPYTRALLDAVPSMRPGPRRRGRGAGRPADRTRVPSTGCPYRPRCTRADEHCATAPPPMTDVGGGVQAACFIPIDPPIARSHP